MNCDITQMIIMIGELLDLVLKKCKLTKKQEFYESELLRKYSA